MGSCWAICAWLGTLESCCSVLQERVASGRRLRQEGGVARELHEAMPQRAARILGEEQGVGVVVEPREPEQVPLVGQPVRAVGRVVGEGIQEEVEVVEALRERRRRARERLGRLVDVLEGRLNRAGERPDLILKRASGLPEQRADLTQGRRQRLRRRNQLPRGRPENLCELVRAGESALRLLQGRRELLERRPDRVLLLRERAQNGVGRAHESRQLRIAMTELGAQLAEVGDHPAQVLTPLRERAVYAGDVADGRARSAAGRPTAVPNARTAPGPRLGAAAAGTTGCRRRGWPGSGPD